MFLGGLMEPDQSRTRAKLGTVKFVLPEVEFKELECSDVIWQAQLSS